ncbi:hypothetical protein J6590_104885, partial [Homalodisca vitripennis]
AGRTGPERSESRPDPTCRFLQIVFLIKKVLQNSSQMSRVARLPSGMMATTKTSHLDNVLRVSLSHIHFTLDD